MHHVCQKRLSCHFDLIYRALNNISVFLSLKTKLLSGYNFPVFSTESCPTNRIEWALRSSALQCPGGDGYMCMPNENLTLLLEFCYIPPIIPIEQGKKKE